LNTDDEEIEIETKESEEFESKKASDKTQGNDIKMKNVFKRFLYWICGMDVILKNRANRQVKQKIDTSIDEDKFLSFICDLLAVIVIASVGFTFGFFNRFD
jgi:hypothetical protein